MRSAVATTAALAVCLAGACRPEEPARTSSQPLIGGTVPADDTDLYAVSLTSPTNFSFCTGTLVSPQVIASAAHCVEMASADPSVVIFFGTDIEGEGTRIGVKKAQANPGWTGSLSTGHDIGLLLMNFRAPEGVEPVPLFTGDLSSHVGDPVRRVGFGIYDAATQEADGKKRVGTTTINVVPDGTDIFYAGDENLITCNGDSGGPSLLDVDGVRTLAGVHSFGFEGCTSPQNGDTRVDMYAEEFVVPWIQENDPTCGEDGFCAKVGCIDDPDCTPCGADGTCTSDCPLPDVDCPTQGIGDICRADSQCADGGPCVFWKDDDSYHFCSRACDPAADDCPDGMSCQNLVGFGDICYYDEAPAGVLGDECEAATDCGSYVCEEKTCVKACDLSVGLGCPEGFECSTLDGESYNCHAVPAEEDGGGCSAGGSSPGRGASLLALALLGLFTGARRRRGSSRDPAPGSSRPRRRRSRS